MERKLEQLRQLMAMCNDTMGRFDPSAKRIGGDLLPQPQWKWDVWSSAAETRNRLSDLHHQLLVQRYGCAA
jgi:two-component SAPR family response regulator